MEGVKIIGNAYKLIKPLFQVRNYFYAQGNGHFIQFAALPKTMKSRTLRLYPEWDLVCLRKLGSF